MTIRKTLTALLVTGVLLSQSVRAAAAAPGQQKMMQQAALQQQMSALQPNYAAGAPNAQAVRPMANDLLGTCQVKAAIGAGGLYLTSTTIATKKVSKVGLSSVVLQYSTNNADFTDATFYGGLYSTNASAHFENRRFYASTRGAGYYRFKVTHYARNGISSPQTVTQYTNSFWLYY